MALNIIAAVNRCKSLVYVSSWFVRLESFSLQVFFAYLHANVLIPHLYWSIKWNMPVLSFLVLHFVIQRIKQV